MKIVYNILLAFLIVFPYRADAQMFKMIGCVQDNVSNLPLPYSVIQIVSDEDSAVFNGVVTNEDGSFLFENVDLPESDYTIVVSYIGYEAYIKPLKVDKKRKEINLGSLYMNAQAQLIDEVTVTANINTRYVDKKKYAVTESLLSNVSVSTDLLRKIPELMVDELLRTVTIKGKENVLVLVNGVNTGVSVDLRSINFRDIKSIEVISSTSSGTDVEYDGIINIILKSEIRQGVSMESEVTVLANWNSSDVYAGLIWGKDKVRTKLSYMNLYRALPYHVSQTRENEELGTSYQEDGYCRDPFEMSHNVLFNVDYHLSQHDFFNLSTSTGLFHRDRSIYNDVYETGDGAMKELPGFTTQNKADITDGNYTFFYRRQMRDPADYFSINTNISFNNTAYKTRTVYEDERLLLNEEPSDKYSMNMKAEYNKTINDIFRLNVGGQWYFQDYDGSLNNKPDDGSLRNHRYNGYADLYLTFKSYSIMVGFKAEINEYKFKKHEYGSHTRSVIQPQLTIRKKINKIHSIAFSYRRRPYYPSPWRLAPYEIQINDKTISKGNPELKSQVYDMLDLNHTLDTDKNIFLRSSVYWNHCNNRIVSLPSFREDLVSVTMPSNDGLYNRVGLKINVSMRILKFIQFDPVLDFFYESMRAGEATYDVFSPSVGGNLMVWLPAGFAIGAYGSYHGKRAVEGGYREKLYSIDAAFVMKRFEKINLNLFLGYQYLMNSPEISTTYNDHVLQRNYSKSDANGLVFRANFYFNAGKKTKMESVKTYFDTDSRKD